MAIVFQELLAVVDTLEIALAQHDADNPAPDGVDIDWGDYHRRNREFAARVLADLAESHGCRFVIDAVDTCRMQVLGVRVSCTGGPLPLLRAWCRKARALAERVAL